MGYSVSAASASQARRTAAERGPAGGGQWHFVRAAGRLPLADGASRFAALADLVQVLPPVVCGRDLERSHEALRPMVREAEDRNSAPSAAIIDSQSVTSAEKGGRAATMRARGSPEGSGISSWIPEVVAGGCRSTRQHPGPGRGQAGSSKLAGRFPSPAAESGLTAATGQFGRLGGLSLRLGWDGAASKGQP